MRLRFFNAYDTAAPFFRNLVPHLTTAGNEVEVVMSEAKYRSGEDLEKTVAKLHGARTVQTFSLGIQPSSSLAKVWVMLTYSIHAAVYSLFGPDVDCNVFLTQPPLFKLWGYALSKVRRQPYYCVVMDIYPEVTVALGLMSGSALWTRLLAWLSAFTLRKAEGVVVIGRCMAERIEAMGVPPERIHFIPNWADERRIRPVEHAENGFRNKQDLKGKFVVLYAGNIGMPQHFADILTVAKHLQEEQDITFLFVGGGSRQDEIKATIERHQLPNVVLLPFLHEVYPLAEILSAGDLHFVTLRESITGLAVPSKSYSILAAGRPIIYQGNEYGEIARMILEEDIGSVVRCGDVDGLEQCTLRYVNHPDVRRRQGEKARKLAEGTYGRMHALERYTALLTGQAVDESIDP